MRQRASTPTRCERDLTTNSRRHHNNLAKSLAQTGPDQVNLVTVKLPLTSNPRMGTVPDPVMSLPGGRPAAVGWTLTVPVRETAKPVLLMSSVSLPLESSLAVMTPLAVLPATVMEPVTELIVWEVMRISKS